ncbi:DUF397 domain-containing protein [Salinactinospora qingdaonensis]|uniref:DUF397 domain-containing protein n=1 Tax=Salinactinospora qingdaonensis TaxID=702744 RepID=A0ABP7FUW8_9ACTN
MSSELAGLTWHKSSYSNANGECVEVAELPSAMLVRDTQNRARGHLAFSAAEWAALLSEVKCDRL